jgi:hypothetical protein
LGDSGRYHCIEERLAKSVKLISLKEEEEEEETERILCIILEGIFACVFDIGCFLVVDAKSTSATLKAGRS